MNAEAGVSSSIAWKFIREFWELNIEKYKGAQYWLSTITEADLCKSVRASKKYSELGRFGTDYVTQNVI